MIIVGSTGIEVTTGIEATTRMKMTTGIEATTEMKITTGIGATTGSLEPETPSLPVNSGDTTAFFISAVVAGASCLFLTLAIVLVIWTRTRTRMQMGEAMPTAFYDEDVGGAREQTRAEDVYLSDIHVGVRVGEGRSGEVFVGLWNNTTQVACKRARGRASCDDLENEVAVLKELNHPHVVRFYGLFRDHPGNDIYLITEYVEQGSLDIFLGLASTRETLQTEGLIWRSLSVAAGMRYLEAREIEHRDLAARNLLVSETNGDYLVKIADFGAAMSTEKVTRREGDEEARAFPVRWSAPEVMKSGKYDKKSDVWSFAVVLWELFSYGEQPYPGMSNALVQQNLDSGYRMPKPILCPEEIYGLMQLCWNEDPNGRPSFANIYDALTIVANALDSRTNRRLTGVSMERVPRSEDAGGISFYRERGEVEEYYVGGVEE